jgi:N-acetylmuramoyl-L-alanine amidase CwlA
MKNITRLVYKYRYVLPLLLIIPIIAGVSFKRIMDKTVKKRRFPVEYLVIHYTANTNPGSDAEANAYYLRNKHRAGTHYCIDDQEIIQCTDEQNVAYAIGDKTWFGFVPKPWFINPKGGRKVLNNNSLNYEMCLGGGRNDTIIIETTAQQIGFQIVKYGFYDKNGVPDLGRVLRHHDITGKYCPKFNYIDPITGKFNENYWDQEKEDISFWKFKLRVKYWAEFHLKRLGKIKPTTKDAIPQPTLQKTGTW